MFLCFDDTCLLHDSGPAHPESEHRLSAIVGHLRERGLWDRLVPLASRAATREEIEAVHVPEVADRVAATGRRTGWLDGDTHVGRRSYEAALLAAGATLAAADEVMTGSTRRGFCLVRPPGHHATRDRSMGFCLFNNLAVCARYLKARHGVERVAIVDFDVHHGNGTEDVFRTDPTVLYVSLHRWPFYPGTGGPGSDASGMEAIVNVPLPAEVSLDEYLAAYDLALGSVREFQPEVLLVSAGFDAHRDDPIGGLCLRTEDFGLLTGKLVRIADETAGGRLISALEGGYHLGRLGPSVEAHLLALDPALTS